MAVGLWLKTSKAAQRLQNWTSPATIEVKIETEPYISGAIALAEDIPDMGALSVLSSKSNELLADGDRPCPKASKETM
jgi:hypothetical protein